MKMVWFNPNGYGTLTALKRLIGARCTPVVIHLFLICRDRKVRVFGILHRVLARVHGLVVSGLEPC